MASPWPSPTWLLLFCIVTAQPIASFRFNYQSLAKEVGATQATQSRSSTAMQPFKGTWDEISRKMIKSGLPWEMFLYSAISSSAIYEDVDGEFHRFLTARHFVKAASMHRRIDVWVPGSSLCKQPMVIVALRGSAGAVDAITDTILTLDGASFTQRYLDDLRLMSNLQEKIAVEYRTALGTHGMTKLPWVLTGHSLGAALAADIYFNHLYKSPFTHCIVFNKPYAADHQEYTPAGATMVQNAARKYWVFDKAFDPVTGFCHMWECNPEGSNWMLLKHEGSIQEKAGGYWSSMHFRENHAVSHWVNYFCFHAPMGLDLGCAMPGVKRKVKVA